MRYWQILVEQELKRIDELGGNAFSDSILVRIKKENVLPTIRYMVNTLNYVGLTYDYVINNLMGSTGKKESSGDIDIAIDSSIFQLKDIAAKLREVLPEEFIKTKGLKGGQINSAWPIVKPDGTFDSGRIQIDFIAGNPEWLKFSHHSAGDISKYPGVYISTMFGVLAKMLKDFELWPQDSERENKLDRIARVGLHYDLEKGLKRKWELQKRKGHGTSDIDPDDWESNVPINNPPRFTRIGFIDNPEAVLGILLPGVKPDQVDTFEKLWAVIKHHPLWKHKLNEVKTRFIEAIQRSSAVKHSVSDFEEPEVFKNE